MKYDVIVSGVGGQGILSISFVLDNAALDEGLRFKQSEVHGMAQRGGAVVSHLRIGEKEIYSDLVPLGKADLALSMEPLETLRYVQYLSPEGWLVSSTSPFVNIPNYPDLDDVLAKLQKYENHILVNSADLARAAGSHYSQNIVMLGAASQKVPMENKVMEKYIGVLFQSKGEKIVDVNIRAFRYGALAGGLYRELLDAGVDKKAAIIISGKFEPKDPDKKAAARLAALARKAGSDIFLGWLKDKRGLVAYTDENLSRWEALNLEEVKATDFEI